MKNLIRAMTTALLASFLLVAYGCSSPTAISNSNVSEASSSHSSSIAAAAAKDSTIKITEFDLTGREDKISQKQSISLSQSFRSSCQDFDGLYKNSTDIVSCTVQGVRFAVDNGIPYNIADVKITETLKGSLNAGDLISVVQMGGYMTLQDEVEAFDNEFRFPGTTKEERKNTIIEKKGSQDLYPQSGDSYVFYLTLCENGIFSGGYSPVNDYECRYKLDKAGKYTRTVPDVEGAKALLTDAEGSAQSVNSCSLAWMKEQLNLVAGIQ